METTEELRQEELMPSAVEVTTSTQPPVDPEQGNNGEHDCWFEKIVKNAPHQGKSKGENTS